MPFHITCRIHECVFGILAQAEQALRLAEAHSDIWGRIQASAILGDVFLLQGDLPPAS